MVKIVEDIYEHFYSINYIYGVQWLKVYLVHNIFIHFFVLGLQSNIKVTVVVSSIGWQPRRRCGQKPSL